MLKIGDKFKRESMQCTYEVIAIDSDTVLVEWTHPSVDMFYRCVERTSKCWFPKSQFGKVFVKMDK